MTSKQVSYKCYCPLCGRKFSAKAAWKHINDYHPKASERELMMIRDVKREKISFATKPLNANKNAIKNAILYQMHRSSGPDYSGGLPSLGKKK
ncbi:hypothetical protein ACAH44_005114 [Escherichia coli]|uniref:hypothetical protein n=1 Tax=Escherichia TaxID=561 RepID=UPI0011E6ED41|nr:MULTISPECIES: hypothetical protein [Escherichia]ELM0541286.1 hypothetical protein [Escherichia coli]ELT3955691.1 hypothetical protein [Escherichia coli]ELX7864482.1 hypothetical protein [Escherichia coli]QMB01105.1 hypothetical protein HV012_08815 [Escherichia fergusonii]QMB10072.1 hypothetical protein HV010_08815 [Escherichia fergusonii]